MTFTYFFRLQINLCLRILKLIRSGKLSVAYYWFYCRSITMKSLYYSGNKVVNTNFLIALPRAEPIKLYVPNWNDLHITLQNPKINGYFSLNIRKLFYYKICFLLSANFAFSRKWIPNSCAYFIHRSKSFSRPGSSVVAALTLRVFFLFFITSRYFSISLRVCGIFFAAILIKTTRL